MATEENHPITGQRPVRARRKPRVAPRTPRLLVTFRDHQWTVTLDGQPLEDVLAPHGLVIRAGGGPDPQPTCTVELTFADVDLDADLADAVLIVAQQTGFVPDPPEGFVQSRVIGGPGIQSSFETEQTAVESNEVAPTELEPNR